MLRNKHKKYEKVKCCKQLAPHCLIIRTLHINSAGVSGMGIMLFLRWTINTSEETITVLNICHLPSSPTFSLAPTFKSVDCWCFSLILFALCIQYVKMRWFFYLCKQYLLCSFHRKSFYMPHREQNRLREKNWGSHYVCVSLRGRGPNFRQCQNLRLLS